MEEKWRIFLIKVKFFGTKQKGGKTKKNVCANIKDVNGNDGERKDRGGEHFNELYSVGRQKEEN